mmetsp:Transcript_18036/g.42144  ORF Transcript_18036/g.42144 Transcript_18036/m.42144 type:complete len:372 (-) Transcript_18036:27-1142(-)
MFESHTSEVLRQRWNEPLKFLPIAFVTALIIGLYTIYTVFHCIPLLSHPDADRLRGAFLCILFHLTTALLVTCYIKCILIHPGTIPDREEDIRWQYYPAQDSQTPADMLPPGLQDAKETKRSGDRRVCKWCQKYKPDRCHHCRVCRLCILKMDHHCPWIYNCVGFHNHKYFFLLLLYSTFNCHLIVWTMYPSVQAAMAPTEPFIKMYCLLFGEALASFLGLLLSFFYLFHIYLMSRAMTTIEFCEKSVKRIGSDSSTYDMGLYRNAKAVLGENILLWFLPCSPPAGDGLSYLTEDTPLLKASAQDVEGGRRRYGARPWRRASPQAGTGSTEDSRSQDSRSCSPDPFGSRSVDGRRLGRDCSVGSHSEFRPA